MSAVVVALREARWLGPPRALAWARSLAVVTAGTVLALVVTTHGGLGPDPWGRPLATDFSSFWTAAKLALQGAPSSAWDPATHAAAQQAAFSGAAGFAGDDYAFFYPPPFLLLCLPLGLLPYGVAAAVWVAATGAVYVGAVRALLPPCWPRLLAAVAFPAVLLNAGHGQNAALSTGLLGGAALLMDRRPWLAGACLGALCLKPHLALPILPALVAARRWRVLAGALAGAGALCLGSLVALGTTSWEAFLASVKLARAALETGSIGFAKMVSPFAAARLAGAPLPAAWATQAVFSLATLAVVAWVARRRPGGRAEGAAMAAGSCLMTPFLLDYDLMLLAVPLAWVASCAERREYLPWEKLVLVGAFGLPLVARSLALGLGLPLAPLVTASLLAIVARRAALLTRVGPGKSEQGPSAAPWRGVLRRRDR